MFYGKPSEPEVCRQFMKERLEKDDSVVFMAYDGDDAAGFIQLYPIFSSVSAQSDYLLNDLFVAEEFRGRGIGEALLERCKEHCTEVSAKGLMLETAHDNPARFLYQKLGWKLMDTVGHYYWQA